MLNHLLAELFEFGCVVCECVLFTLIVGLVIRELTVVVGSDGICGPDKRLAV